MKKLILLVCFLFVPLLASAQQGDTLLTADGTLYSVHFERAHEHPDVETQSSAYLVLTSRRGDETQREIIPATLEKGAHFAPAIAYDAQSGMLFAFWIHNATMLSNQLRFASRDANGVWSDPTIIGDYYDQRANLTLAVTRKYEGENGETQSGLTVHLSWWQFNYQSATHTAQYLMIPIEDGRAAEPVALDLTQFVDKKGQPEVEEETTEKATIDASVLEHPVLFASAKQDSVVVVFGDADSNTMQTVRVRPRKIAGDGRLRVPGGKRENAFAAPKLDVPSNVRVEGVYGDDDRMALYTREAGKLRYVVLKDGAWSEAHAIMLDEELSSGGAIDALRRLVSEH
jgi:hypothetical protein